MRTYVAFVSKEFVESARTYKLLIIFVVFLMFGMFNPVAAKVMPDILTSVMPEGISVSFSQPTAIDSWTQFYKNMTGMQIVVFVILFSNIVSGEISKGTLVNMLTKGLSRKTVILSKITSTVVIWTLGYMLCFAVTYIYTLYLLPGDLPHIFFSAVCMWLFGVMLISVMIFGGVLFANIYGSLILTGGFSIILMLVNMFPNLKKYNPYMLASDNMRLLSGQVVLADFYFSTCIALVTTVIFIVSSVIIFNKARV